MRGRLRAALGRCGFPAMRSKKASRQARQVALTWFSRRSALASFLRLLPVAPVSPRRVGPRHADRPDDPPGSVRRCRRSPSSTCPSCRQSTAKHRLTTIVETTTAAAADPLSPAPLVPAGLKPSTIRSPAARRDDHRVHREAALRRPVDVLQAQDQGELVQGERHARAEHQAADLLPKARGQVAISRRGRSVTMRTTPMTM